MVLQFEWCQNSVLRFLLGLKGIYFNVYGIVYRRRGAPLPPPLPPEGAGEGALRAGGDEKLGWLLRGAGALFTGGRLSCITGGVDGRGCVEGFGCVAGAGVGRVVGVGLEVGLPPGCVCTGVLLLRGALGAGAGDGRPLLPGAWRCGGLTVFPLGPR